MKALVRADGLLAVSLLCTLGSRARGSAASLLHRPQSGPGHLHRTQAQPQQRRASAQMVTRYPKPLVVEPRGQHKSSIVIIHGLGDSGEGWIDFAPELGAGLPGTKFIFPTAPQLPVALNGGMVMNAWYDITSLDKIHAREDEANLKASAAYIESLVKAETDAGIDSRKIVVAGFSQGGALALLSLRQAQPLAGVLSMSGYLTLAKEPLVSEANKQTPLLMCHGAADPVVAHHYGLESYELLRAAGVNVTFKSYPGLGHSLAPKEIADIKQFLGERLAA